MVKSVKFYQRLVQQRRARAAVAAPQEPSAVVSPPMVDDAPAKNSRKSNSKS